MADLIADPNPAITPADGSEIRTDQHNEIRLRLGGTSRLTASRVVVTDANGLQTVSDVTSNKLSFGWIFLGDHRLTVAGDVMTVTGIPAEYTHLLIMANIIKSGTADGLLRFNNDSGNNYASRQELAGAADTTTVNANAIIVSGSGTDQSNHIVCICSNIVTIEKIGNIITGGSGGAGAGNAPGKRVAIGKWANVVDSISRVDIINSQTGSFDVGSELAVWGSF